MYAEIAQYRYFFVVPVKYSIDTERERERERKGMNDYFCFYFSRARILSMILLQLIKNMNIVSQQLMMQVLVNQVIHRVVSLLNQKKVKEFNDCFLSLS
jgi:hypothetical protein